MSNLNFGFIVEGFHDETLFRQVISNSDFKVIPLGGNGLTKHLERVIESVMEDGTVLFLATDPDWAGDQIAEKILNIHPDMVRLEFDPKKCQYNRPNRISYGIEHTSREHVIEVIEQTYERINILAKEEWTECFLDRNRSKERYNILSKKLLVISQALSKIHYGNRYI